MTLTANSPITLVKMAGFGYLTDWSNRTVNLAAGITATDIGKAVTFDATAANKYKLAVDGAPIHGRLEVVETRTNEGTLVGTVKLFPAGVKMPVKAADALAAGDNAIGAANGEIRKLIAGDVTAGAIKNIYVTEVVAGFATVYHA